MRVRNPFAQAVLLVIAAMAIGIIANGFAGRTRRLVLPGWYPNAMKAPKRAPVAAPAPPATATAAPVPVAAATTTTVAPVVETVTTATATQQPSDPAAQKPIQKPVEKPADLSKFTPHPDKAYVEITGEDAAALHKAGTLFLDARRTSIYEDGHIAGARSFSVWEADVDDKVTALYEERQDPAEQNKPIVIYCSGGACEDSHMLAQKLWGVQFNNVYVYKDGFPDWEKRGLAVRKGATP